LRREALSHPFDGNHGDCSVVELRWQAMQRIAGVDVYSVEA
jgi:hypothetical protein